MAALDLVTDYLRKKVKQRGRPSDGVTLLKLHKNLDEDLEKLVSISFQVIQYHFTKTSSDSPAGVAMLTAVSTLIGTKVAKQIQREPLTWKMQVKLGDLFIEAYYNTGFVDLYYSQTFDGCYIVSATLQWTDLADLPEAVARYNLIGTSNTPQKGITVKGNDDMVTDESKAFVRAANKLQATGWQINRRVYDALADPKNKELFVSDEPILDNEAKEQKRRSKEVEWGFIMGKADLILHDDEFRNKPFYQSLEADYRGRLYYNEPFLNYQGSDLARGMLQFARRKPMTPDGLYWLSVHTANSFNMSYGIDEIPDICEQDYRSHLEAEGLESISVDKWTLDDRVEWVNAHMDEIVAYGKTNQFHMKAEKPVSFLACCIEWYDYWKAAQANKIYYTQLPIAVDGSNNGWQHLGAISKDPQTGKLVGLSPVDIQQDFYVQTAKELYKLTEGELREKLDGMPMKHIRKGISKRGSMTRAYSAGAEKIGENMWFDCRTEDFHEKYGITEDDCMAYAKLLIKAIDTVCPGPLDTMGYLQSLAAFEIGKYLHYRDGEEAESAWQKIRREIKEIYAARAERNKDKKKDEEREPFTDEELDRLDTLKKEQQEFESVLVYGNGSKDIRWTTPSDFHVIYEDWVMYSDRCQSTISGLKSNGAKGNQSQVKHVGNIETEAPDVRKFMCGISPNFIHSMDASHMALVIDNWHREFGAVHDSFSSHACDVEDMLALTKQIFIEMYDVDNFYSFIEDQLITNKEGLDIAKLQPGSLDIGGIYESDYFFA